VALPVAGGPVELRGATAADLPALVALLADGDLGAHREAADGDLTQYRAAFGLPFTSGKARGDAHRFYGRLGFLPTRDGFTLALPEPPRAAG
jgi:hypothetical protein